jgi:hypothetical protein
MLIGLLYKQNLWLNYFGIQIFDQGTLSLEFNSVEKLVHDCQIASDRDFIHVFHFCVFLWQALSSIKILCDLNLQV